MKADILLALFVASFVNAALPGPCMIATMGRTLRGGWRAGALVSLGVLAADTLLVAAAIAALLGVLSLSPAALTAMKWAGIAALLGLAVQCLRAPKPRAAGGASGRGCVLTGVTVGLSSPYNLVFYLALMPQILTGAAPPGFLLGVAAALLGGILLAQAGAVLLSGACGRLGPGGGRRVDQATAALMVVLAMAAALAPLDLSDAGQGLALAG